uniref:Uncharacterized protein n=1 Tax=Sphaerodactylus townsendi TaxID=933632 RepID=A0ACB8GAA1_9SAUR
MDTLKIKPVAATVAMRSPVAGTGALCPTGPKPESVALVRREPPALARALHLASPAAKPLLPLLPAASVAAATAGFIFVSPFPAPREYGAH